MGADRLAAEAAFHDAQAHARAASFRSGSASLRFDDADYLDHESWIRPAMAALGEVRGRAVLDFGCGHGMAAVVLARAGARVTALDLSHGYLGEARQRAEANGVSMAFVRADGEALPFADGAFNALWGNAILHHLDLGRTAPELRRVLRPGGVAVFCEPWGENPVLDWARRRVRYPAKARTRDEAPLRRPQVARLARVFGSVDVRGCQLLGMTRRIWKGRRVAAGLDWCDAVLLRHVRPLASYCRYVVIALKR